MTVCKLTIQTLHDIDSSSEAVVGLERTLYQVLEDVGVVEVCAIVYNPSGDCPITLSFNVLLSSEDGTGVHRAGMNMQFRCITVIYIYIQNSIE